MYFQSRANEVKGEDYSTSPPPTTEEVTLINTYILNMMLLVRKILVQYIAIIKRALKAPQKVKRKHHDRGTLLFSSQIRRALATLAFGMDG